MHIERNHSNLGWSGFGLAQLLTLLFLVASLLWAWRKLEVLLLNDRVAGFLTVEQTLSSALGWQLAAFGCVLLLCHAVLGLLAFALARMTETAFAASTPAWRGWLITGWFVLLAVLVLAANITFHPASIFSVEASWWRDKALGLYPVQIAAAASGLLVIWLATRAFTRMRTVNLLVAAAVTGTICLALITSVALSRVPNAAAPPVVSSPHIVIIGIDSLRNDLSLPRLGSASIPHVREFLARAKYFSDATTPLARTFGSWVSILTGRHPVATNARVNLMPRKLVEEGETLADSLRERGYKTIYATDETRFANIDESYGFDQLIAPPIGAVDFLLGYAGDIPLVNLIASTPAGRWLFPSNHANRAANGIYQPAAFVRRLKNEIRIDGPAFLAIHLTLAHWPYNWAGWPVPGTPPEYRTAYRRAVEEVDGQFDAVMQLLAENGVLDNALVVLLSDHGEALGANTDSMLRKTGAHREIWDSLWGHGTSVMSPHQYGVLLAMRAYGRARLPGSPGRYDWPVSLEDLRPTLEDYATGKAPVNVDGISLLPFLEQPDLASRLEARVRFTETDFNTPSTLAGRYEASGLIDEAAVYYELEPASGWVQFRAERLPELLARKQRAALSSSSLLAAIPDPESRSVRYLYTDRHNPLPRVLDGRPDPGRDPEAARLWDALQARFPGELPEQSNLP